MNESALITLENAAIGYDNKILLDSINLSVLQGRFLGIIGPNGGGKTTLLKTIIGLIPPVAGELKYPRRLVFGYVPQRDSFDPIIPISVADAVAMGRCARVPVGRRLGRGDLRIAEESLEKLQIGHLKRRTFRSLSGGEKQRALLARAIASEPDVLVLDEPTASVDVKGEAAIMETVRKIKDESGLAVIIVSHYLNAVAKFADTLALVDKDRGIFKSGAADEMFRSDILSDIFGLDVIVEKAAGGIKIRSAG